MSNYSAVEEKVKEFIRNSLNTRIQDFGRIDPDLIDSALIERWLTDIMAIGFNDSDLDKASQDIYEMQKPLEGLTKQQVLLEDIRGRVYLSDSRFGEEIEAFKKYVELRKTESIEIILFKVKEEIEHIKAGDFYII